METTPGTGTAQSAAKNRVNTIPLRVRRETKRRLVQELAKLNRKDFGRNVRANDLIALALTLVQPEHLKQLQEATLSNADRLDRMYSEHVKKHGQIGKDEFIGMVMTGGASAVKDRVEKEAR